MVRLLITLTTVTLVTCQFVFKPGPLIPASKGEIWPTVQHEDKLDDGYFSMLPLFFQFKVNTYVIVGFLFYKLVELYSYVLTLLVQC